MREDSLRSVLLIEAIEECDHEGRLIPPAERAEATRKVLRQRRDAGPVTEGLALTARGEDLLVARAHFLSERLFSRQPVVSRMLHLAGRAAGHGWIVIAIALSLGLLLPSIDGGQRINVLAFPLLGLVAWNLGVYAVLIVWRARGLTRGARIAGDALPAGRWLQRVRLRSITKRMQSADAVLARALPRFLAAWQEIAGRQLLLRSRRLMHLAAVAVAAGLIGGLYLRGLVLEYQAGWESTFLGPRAVATLLAVVFGPASAISGIPLPGSEDAVVAMRWRLLDGGVPAAPWIHLIALTASLYVLIPRLALAAVDTLALRRSVGRTRLTAGSLAYARRVLGADAAIDRTVIVMSYGYELSPPSTAGLRLLLSDALGSQVTLELRPPMRYGEEDEAVAVQLEPAGTMAGRLSVLVMNLASTPEDENHGAILTAIRHALVASGRNGAVAVIVDASSYAARMTGDPTYAARLEERRRLWRQFVAARGLEACVTSLAEIAARGTTSAEEAQALRAALQSGELPAHE